MSSETAVSRITIGELAVRFGCTLKGDPDDEITAVASLANAEPGALTFLANRQYRDALGGTRATAVLLAEDDAQACPVACLITPTPYPTFARIAQLLHPEPPVEPGVHDSAVVSEQAHVDPTAQVGPFAVIESGAVVGARVLVGPGSYVARGVRLGADSRLIAGVTLMTDVQVGERCILHPGAVIGADGFGLAQDSGGWVKVPQLGSVVLGDDVEIGAHTTVDRGAIDPTVIENGVKLDNHIQVGHNCHIGAHTVMAAKVGIAGSTRIGKRCMIAGDAGFVGHLEVCDDVVLTARALVMQTITEPGVYSGVLGAEESKRWRRNAVRFKNLDGLARRIQTLEKRLKQLEAKGEGS